MVTGWWEESFQGASSCGAEPAEEGVGLQFQPIGGGGEAEEAASRENTREIEAECGQSAGGRVAKCADAGLLCGRLCGRAALALGVQPVEWGRLTALRSSAPSGWARGPHPKAGRGAGRRPELDGLR